MLSCSVSVGIANGLLLEEGRRGSWSLLLLLRHVSLDLSGASEPV